MVTNRGKIKSNEQRNKEERDILMPLRAAFKASSFDRSGESIKLPEYVSISIVGSTLLININTATHPESGKTINPVCDNMQNDACAFEGWAICIKAWLGEKVEKVDLNWVRPDDVSKKGHYNRFIYRVMKFAEWYDWFSFDETHNGEIAGIREIMQDSANNSSSKEAERKTGTRYEEQVEFDLIHVPTNKDLISNTLGCSKMWHHLPVGVKDKHNCDIFTGGQSAIDLWGVTDKDLLVLVELKYNKKYKETKEILHNIKVGIISELMFYCNVMNDIRLGKIKRPKPQTPPECSLYGKAWSGVEGVMLATDFHPLLYKVDEITSLLNSNKAGIKFSLYEYKWDLDKNLLLNIGKFQPLPCK